MAGVGVAAFHTLVHDFSMAASGKDIVPDNAQNWFRHHLAELGVLGSLPWLAWCVVFALRLFARRGRRSLLRWRAARTAGRLRHRLDAGHAGPVTAGGP